MPKITSEDGLSVKERLTLKAYSDPNSDSYLNASKSASKFYNTSSSKANTVIGTRVKKKLALVSFDPSFNPDLVEKMRPEWILGRLSKLATTSKKEADQIKALELMGKFKDLNLWREHQVNELATTKVESEEDLDAEFKALVEAKEAEANLHDDKTDPTT